MNKKLLMSIRDDPIKWARLFGFPDLRDWQNEWLKAMIFATNDYTLLALRNSFKTTLVAIALAFLIVLRPDKTIFFLRKTDGDVVEIIRQVVKILEHPVMRYIVRELYGVELELVTASAAKIETNLMIGAKGQVQLLGMGLNSSLTGKHADYIFTDDIVNDSDRVSAAEREQTKRKYQELQNIRNRGGRIFNTGTMWHKEDATNELMMKTTDVHIWTIYDTDIFTPEQIEQKRQSMSPALFAANYEMKLIADADALFTAPKWLLPDDKDNNLIHGASAHVDAAYDGEDYTAYTAMHELKDGRIIAYGRMWRRHVDDCIAEITAQHTAHQCGTIACETNADKGYLAKSLREHGFHTRTYAEGMNKYLKIATYLRKNWARIYWTADTDPDYIAQILDYTEHAAHDDAPDSAASLLRSFEAGVKLNTNPAMRRLI